MKFYLDKANKFNQYCTHNDCEENPKFFLKTAKPGWRKKIRIGQVIGVIEVGAMRETYCRDCIDKLYREFKLVFDSKLWPFH